MKKTVQFFNNLILVPILAFFYVVAFGVAFLVFRLSAKNTGPVSPVWEKPASKGRLAEDLKSAF